jgi:hypothetical protein
MAATVYNWSFTDGASQVVASGTLEVGGPMTVNVGGSTQTIYQVLGAAGTIAGIDGFTAEHIFLYGGFVTPLSYNVIGNETYDNALFAGLPTLDGNGLEFIGTTGDFLNIYNDINTGGYTPGNDPGHDVIWNNGSGAATGTFNIAPVPEPATWAMMLLGVALLGGWMRWGRQPEAGARAA